MSDLKQRVQITDLEFKNEKTPYSSHFQDVYFSPESGIEESRYVYLEGSGALASFASGSARITIAEIGFGAGFNFLLTMKEFLKSGGPGQLHYFSFENHPVRKSSLERLFQSHPDLKDEFQMLIREYPVLTPGIHLIRLLEGRVLLYLCLGDATELLSRIEFEADHWYWDGFAPRRNPEAFSESLFLQVKRHSKKGTKGASFTSAGWVRRTLENSGFRVTKREGFGHKRECITAVFEGEDEQLPKAPWYSRKSQKSLIPPMKTAVIGAGLGGTAIARALAERGHEVAVFDPHGIAGRASSNPVGLFNAQLSKIPNPVSRFSQLSLVCLMRELDRLGIKTRRGILRTDIEDPSPLVASEYPSDFYEVRDSGIFFPTCGMIDPRELCKARMSHPGIKFQSDSLFSVERNQDRISLTLVKQKDTLGFDHVVYCLGADAKLEGASEFQDYLHGLNPTRPIRGQILLTTPVGKSESLPHALVEEGYATPLQDGFHLIGATYQAKTVLPDQEEIDTRALISAARKWSEFQDLSIDQVKGSKVGYRLSTPDKLPMIGPLCDPHWMKQHYSKALKGAKEVSAPPLESPPGEWLLTGLGSRGITYSSLASEILAEWMTGNPVPLEQDLLEHIHSARFFVRKLRKAEVE